MAVVRQCGEIRGRARQAEAVTWSGALWLTAETLLGVLLLDQRGNYFSLGRPQGEETERKRNTSTREHKS